MRSSSDAGDLVRLGLIGAAAGIGLGWLITRGERCDYPGPRPKSRGVPFYGGDPCPAWPTVSTHSRGHEVAYRDGGPHGNQSRAFSACRDGCSRHHAGVDLYARAGDPVLAMEGGRVVAIQTFAGGLMAVLVESSHGVVLYGEVDRIRVKRGDIVGKGVQLAQVGMWPSGSHMLHLETYARGTRRNKRWFGKIPRVLRDPTDFLLRARST